MINKIIFISKFIKIISLVIISFFITRCALLDLNDYSHFDSEDPWSMNSDNISTSPPSGSASSFSNAPRKKSDDYSYDSPSADTSHQKSRYYKPSYAADGDISIGMNTSNVYQSWGEPQKVETAGNPRSGNERWIYRSNSTSFWSDSSAKIVYFENGQVVGWETQ